MNDTQIFVELTALTQGGSAIGPIAEGPASLLNKKAFVPFSIPGERVQVTVTADKGSYCEAQLVEVVRPVAERVAAPCRYFSKCGGCQLQHIELVAQRQMKFAMVVSALKVKGITSNSTAQLLGQNLPGYNYRRRISLHVNQQGMLGFYKSLSGDLVEIDSCLLADAVINQGLQQLLKLQNILANKVAGVEIENSSGRAVFIFSTGYDFTLPKIDSLGRALSDQLVNFAIKKDAKLLFSKLDQYIDSASDQQLAGHFSQVNPEANKILLELVASLAVGKSVDDLYAGYGNLSLDLAKAGSKVRAIEIDPALIEYGKTLSQELNISSNIEFINSSAEKFVKRNSLAKTIILDPPRSGAKLVCQSIATNDTERIIYVSCNLPNFVRDSTILIAKGFQLNRLYVLDMFSQTFHVEIIGEFICERLVKL